MTKYACTPMESMPQCISKYILTSQLRSSSRNRILIYSLPSANLSLIDINSYSSISTRTSSSNSLLLSSNLLGWLESLSDRLNHLSKPVEVQRVENDIRAQICKSQPKRNKLLACELHDVAVDGSCTLASCCIVSCHGVIVQRIVMNRRRRWLVVDCCPDILVDAHGLVGAPNQAAGEEHDKKQDAIVELSFRSGHIKFVEEPVEV